MAKAKASFRAMILKDMAIFFRATFELWRGFHFLRKTDRAVSIFGSARLPNDHEYCQQAKEFAAEYARRGYTVFTGGGPGIMQAANQGAFEAGGRSVGINITLPYEQNINPFVTASLRCRYFFVRKVLLVRYSECFLIFPGGFGTLDEFFELVTLLQTGKMADRQIYLVNKKFWAGLLDWCEQALIPTGMIKRQEINRIRVVDTVQELFSA